MTPLTCRFDTPPELRDTCQEQCNRPHRRASGRHAHRTDPGTACAIQLRFKPSALAGTCPPEGPFLFGEPSNHRARPGRNGPPCQAITSSGRGNATSPQVSCRIGINPSGSAGRSARRSERSSRATHAGYWRIYEIRSPTRSCPHWPRRRDGTRRTHRARCRCDWHRAERYIVQAEAHWPLKTTSLFWSRSRRRSCA